MSLEMEVGQLKGKVEAMDKRLDNVESKLESVDSKVDQILHKISETKGGWKAISIMASIAAAAGALAAKLMHLLGALAH